MSSHIPIGARVHHRGCLWNFDFTEEQRKRKPSWGWATVKKAIEQQDGTYKYLIVKDAAFSPGLKTESYWASYHIDRWEILE